MSNSQIWSLKWIRRGITSDMSANHSFIYKPNQMNLSALCWINLVPWSMNSHCWFHHFPVMFSGNKIMGRCVIPCTSCIASCIHRLWAVSKPWAILRTGGSRTTPCSRPKLESLSALNCTTFSRPWKNMHRLCQQKCRGWTYTVPYYPMKMDVSHEKMDGSHKRNLRLTLWLTKSTSMNTKRYSSW